MSAPPSFAWAYSSVAASASRASGASREVAQGSKGGYFLQGLTATIKPQFLPGFAEEYDIERKFRETRLYQTAPISTNLILSYIGQHVLGMPRSF